MKTANTDPLIVTACLDDAAQCLLDDLRQRYFPKGRTVIGAHLTLFHAIPAENRRVLLETVAPICATQAPFGVTLPSLYSLGRGFAVRVQSAELVGIHQRICAPLRNALTPQDAQAFRPHVTLANKLQPAEAKTMLLDLQATWGPMRARVEALALWRYVGPHWDLDTRLSFG